VKRLTARTAAAGGRIMTALDDGYPAALLTLDPRPPTLFVAGDGAALGERAVAVVGTRRRAPASSWSVASPSASMEPPTEPPFPPVGRSPCCPRRWIESIRRATAPSLARSSAAGERW